MTGGQKVVVAATVAILGVIIAGVVLTTRRPEPPSTTLLGAVLEASSDPTRRTPVADVEVMAATETASAVTKSEVSGLFRLTLSQAITPGQTVTLTVKHPGYEPFQTTQSLRDQLYIVRLRPMHYARTLAAVAAETVVGDLRVRYSVKEAVTMNVGSFARTFQIPAAGRIPCAGSAPCSPDGKWKAVVGVATYDAGEGNEFRAVRISCIAGPCPFTAISPGSAPNTGQKMKVSALNWSDVTTFLVEAEVMRSQINDAIRYSIPVVFGDTMDFTLPGTAEGPSIEADFNNEDIVFPLGPKLYLSWANCTLKTDPDGAKLYRCELKPGFRFH